MNKYDYFFTAGLILWLLETAYFGWNEEAESVAEEMLNAISLALVGFGAIGSIVKAAKSDVRININPQTESDD